MIPFVLQNSLIMLERYSGARFLINRFGTTSCFSTLAFESKIGELRRLGDIHRSRHPTQVTLPKLYWETTLMSSYLEENPYKFVRTNAEVHKHSDDGELVELITESGLIISPKGFYLVNDGNFVKVDSLEVDRNLCMINCSILFRSGASINPGPTYNPVRESKKIACQCKILLRKYERTEKIFFEYDPNHSHDMP